MEDTTVQTAAPPEDVQTLDVDGVKYVIDELPEDIQNLVKTYNIWNKRVYNLQTEGEETLRKYRDQIAVYTAAKSEISRQVLVRIQEEAQLQSEAEAEEEARLEAEKLDSLQMPANESME